MQGNRGIVSEDEEVDLTGSDVVAIDVVGIAEAVDQCLFVLPQVVEVGEGRLRKLDDELVCGLGHGYTLGVRRPLVAHTTWARPDLHCLPAMSVRSDRRRLGSRPVPQLSALLREPSALPSE